MSLRLIPGTYGLPVVGETVAFLRNVVQFVDTRVAYYGHVFRTSVLRFPTIFSCSYESTLDVLTNPAFEAGQAYAEFMSTVYPRGNMMLSDALSSSRAFSKSVLTPVLSGATLATFRIPIQRITAKHLAPIHAAGHLGMHMQPYAFFKQITEDIMTRLVLGDISDEKYTDIRQLCSHHFNAVVAAPVQAEMLGTKTARKRGTESYHALVKIIREAVKEELATASEEASILAAIVREGERMEVDLNEEEVVEFLLLLLSTAIPKSLSSVLASFVERLCGSGGDVLIEELRGENGAEMLDCTLMECMRLRPPLVGGMRMKGGKGEGNVGGYQVGEKCRVWYSILHSNRDESAYEEANMFSARRFLGASVRKVVGCPFARPEEVKGQTKTPLSFGGGERHCPGRDVAWEILRNVGKTIVEELDVWRGMVVGESQLRYLPVVREEVDVEIRVRRRWTQRLEQ